LLYKVTESGLSFPGFGTRFLLAAKNTASSWVGDSITVIGKEKELSLHKYA
jgi:hypothetical protein